jgi:hypothetical protein
VQQLRHVLNRVQLDLKTNCHLPLHLLRAGNSDEVVSLGKNRGATPIRITFCYSSELDEIVVTRRSWPLKKLI